MRKVPRRKTEQLDSSDRKRRAAHDMKQSSCSIVDVKRFEASSSESIGTDRIHLAPMQSPVLSPSKQAVHIMNATSGLFVDPIHYHSFSAVGSDSLFAPAAGISLFSFPKCFLLGTFQKCVACHGRLGNSSSPNHDGSQKSSLASPEIDGTTYSSHSSGMAMLQCVACGVYAHRSCAFIRSLPFETCNNATIENGGSSFSMPTCEVNLPIVREALRSTETHETQPQCQSSSVVSIKSETPKVQSSWSFFKRSSKVENQRKVNTSIDNECPPTEDYSSDETHDEAMDESCRQSRIRSSISQAPPPKNTTLSSPWLSFGRKSCVNEPTTNNDFSDTLERMETHDNGATQQSHDSNGNNLENTDIVTSDEQTEDELSNALLEDTLSCYSCTSDEADTSKTASPPPPGAFRTSLDIILKTSQTRANITKAYGIGMVAGGVAGLAIAGPAGCIVGSQIGKTVLAVGAAVEGGMSVGFLVMSLVAAAKFSQQSRDQRELVLPGHDTTPLVLVRPDIMVDPIWDKYTEEAKVSWEKMNKENQRSSWSCGLGNLFSTGSNDIMKERDVRYHRESDIIQANANELALREKVFLLVNRILNDKFSLPGYVYRYLIRKHIVSSTVQERVTDDNSTAFSNYPSVACRRNAHGIIKHVTETLLQVRRELGSSPIIAEMVAGAVEMLVFGELYDDVFREFIIKTKDQDEKLVSIRKSFNMALNLPICDIEADLDKKETLFNLSHPAILALKTLPEAHTSTHKLNYCVEFLKHISEHFSTRCSNESIDADILLKMVCQHIVAANVNYLHAEVSFIEEFSRDEQLLKGKEGYALITLQASLHYFNSLDKFDRDVFSNNKI